MKKLILIVIVVALGFGIKSCNFAPFNKDDILERYEGEQPLAKDIIYSNRNVRYYVYGDANKPALMFIHGSPGGSWVQWGDYFNDKDIRDRFYIIAIDRLGFGESDNGNAEPSLEHHAGAVKAVLDNEGVSKAVIVGHSYGGPVQYRFAMDYPDYVTRMVVLAGTAHPDIKNIKWYNKLARYDVIKFIIPEALEVSNSEILPLQSELYKMKNRWGEITAPTIIIHGEDDMLVPVIHGKYANDALVNSEHDLIILKDQGHFLPWEQFELVKKYILGD